MVRHADRSSLQQLSARLGRAVVHLPDLCRANHVRRLSAFGSVVGDQFDPIASDLDFVVEFEPGYTLPWMAHITRLQDEMKALFRRPVDVVPRGAAANPYLVQEIAQHEVPLFAEDRLLLPSPLEGKPMTDADPHEPVIRKSLEDIYAACVELDAVRMSKTIADYKSDRFLRWGVERAFTIIGEAMNRVRKRDPSMADQVTAAKSIIAFRNLIVHEYDLVDDDIVWGVIVNHVPMLRQESKTLLDSLTKH